MKGLVRRGWARALLAVVCLVSLLLPMIPGPAAAAPKPERMHPLLSRLADANPNAKVRVIVQGSNPTGQLGTAIDAVASNGKRALPMVRGFAATVPAGKARALANRPDVNWVTLDAPMKPSVAIDNLAVTYPRAVGAPQLWNGATPVTGAGVTVAVLDSGISASLSQDFGPAGSRIVATQKFSPDPSSARDGYGHGTHVAGIVAGNGASSGGKYIGVAPDAKLVDLQVSDRKGMAYISDVVKALEWVVQNRVLYNIRVVNLSLVSSIPESYLTNPLDAAVEMVWLSGIVVIASSGNSGPNTLMYPPANDPFIITVGATDTVGTPDVSDDIIPTWSSYGTTQDGFVKPEVVAPGRMLISNLASNSAELGKLFPDRIVDTNYIRMSGTSMASPVVSGLVALILQAHPTWTPDQVKGALVDTARPLPVAGSGRGAVDGIGAVGTSAPTIANLGIPLNAGVSSIAGTTAYNSATWNSATWNSATWNSATWNSATWNSATWNSATWNSATWNSTTNSATVEDIRDPNTTWFPD